MNQNHKPENGSINKIISVPHQPSSIFINKQALQSLRQETLVGF